MEVVLLFFLMLRLMYCEGVEVLEAFLIVVVCCWLSLLSSFCFCVLFVCLFVLVDGVRGKKRKGRFVGVLFQAHKEKRK